MTDGQEPGPAPSTDFDSIRKQAYSRHPGESFSVPKAEMPTLPSQFSETTLGTPLWIAHPGSSAQYRANPALHAYELDRDWKVHRDRYDPEENPVGHIVFDAPELLIAGFGALVTGIAAYYFLDEHEREKDEGDRRSWWPVLGAFVLAALVGIALYVVAALVRVALGVG
jgi:uncharacterized membrane-anchored protein